MEIGTIKQTAIDADGIDCVVTLAGGAEVTATIYGLPGVECYPLPGDEVAVDWAAGCYVIAAVFRAKHADLGAGDSILYGRGSGGAVASTVHAKADGTVVVNGGDESSVRFSELKSAFDELKGDFNTFLSSAFNVHTHVCAAPGSPSAVPTPTGASSAASVDGAESDSVKIP